MHLLKRGEKNEKLNLFNSLSSIINKPNGPKNIMVILDAKLVQIIIYQNYQQ